MRESYHAAFYSGPPSVFPSSSCCSFLVLMRCREPPWNGRGNAATDHKRRTQKSDLRKFQALAGERMSAMVSYVAPLVPTFPAGADVRWETENRTVWNEQEHASDQRELVYEVSWIA